MDRNDLARIPPRGWLAYLRQETDYPGGGAQERSDQVRRMVDEMKKDPTTPTAVSPTGSCSASRRQRNRGSDEPDARRLQLQQAHLASSQPVRIDPFEDAPGFQKMWRPWLTS
jgi:hypothetical protein